MSKILVTGYRGWIGSNFTKLLDQNNIEWIGIDKLDGDDLLHSFRKFRTKVLECDIVVHLAATPRIPASWDNSDFYRENNVSVTDKVAKTCADLGKHLIFASSSSVYGDGNGPLNPYSWTKLAGEQSIEMYGRAKGLGYTNLRIFTNYSEDDISGLVIGRWLSQHRAGEPLTLRGTGEQSRDFIHVSDTAKALLACCKSKPYQKTLDIGTGVSHRLIDIANKIGGTVTVEPELQGYATATKADLERTQEHIIWWPRVDFDGWLIGQLTK